jgi:hypothetical protein
MSTRYINSNTSGRLALAALALALPIAAMAEAAPDGAPAKSYSGKSNYTPLVEKVRAATARFRDMNVALNEHWVVATPCVSGPNEGAMGVHLVMPSRLADGVLKGDEPEALIYEPMADGAMRLVGVEFIALASSVQTAPKIEGHLMNYVGEPNRYGLPAFYEMHVWAWADNPKGNFADWNTKVSCNNQPLD